MTPFGIAAPGRILFGRGEAARAAGLIAGFGARVLLVHGDEVIADSAQPGGLSGAVKTFKEWVRTTFFSGEGAKH